MTSILSSRRITQFNLQTTPCLSLAFVRVHQMAPPWTVVTTSSCSLLLSYGPRKDEMLSWPSWLTYSGRFTYISGHPSAVGRAMDSYIIDASIYMSMVERRTGKFVTLPYAPNLTPTPVSHVSFPVINSPPLRQLWLRCP